ncbi:MAG: DUF664 domain-containing protein [Acidimicrobiia bacterium]|nr:DUF664 domain-containing protein [Acidimicrobiia bacterium]
MADPIITATRALAVDAFDVLRHSVDGLHADALNRRPAGADTNSIAVLVTHALGATRLLMSLAVGAPLPPRDRDAEFAAQVADPDTLLDAISTIGAECLAILDGAASIDWGAPRQRTRSDGSTWSMTAGYAMLHALDHLRGHADEAALTRHVITRS